MSPLELSGERFRHLAADVVQMTAEYLSTLQQRRVFPVTSGADTERLFAMRMKMRRKMVWARPRSPPSPT